MTKKRTKQVVILIILFFLAYYFMTQYGYSFDENKAIRKSFPYQNGSVVYQKEFGNHKIVIVQIGDMKYVKLVHSKWGILHQVTGVSTLLPREPEEQLTRTWSAHLNSKKNYETIFAVVVEDNKANIDKIIISNDNIDNGIAEDLSDIKSLSTIFIELKVEDGYAVSFNEFPADSSMNYVFRGLDPSGKIVTVRR